MADDPRQQPGHGIARRDVVVAAATCFAMMAEATRAGARQPAGSPPTPAEPAFTKDSEATGMIEYAGIHHGKGTGRIKSFPFGGAPAPANFIVYDLPPGASEGEHTHFLDNRNAEGSFDEYYYIVSGSGEMRIDGRPVPVAAGDHVHTPLEVEHGIENTHPTEHLRVFLTFIKRGNEPAAARRIPQPTRAPEPAAARS